MAMMGQGLETLYLVFLRRHRCRRLLVKVQGEFTVEQQVLASPIASFAVGESRVPTAPDVGPGAASELSVFINQGNQIRTPI